MKRTKEEAEQTKEAIFQAGIKLLTEKGIRETSMTDIAREAGVTRGAIYWHFRNKEELLLEIRGRLTVFYQNLVETISDSELSMATRIGTAVRLVLTKYKSDPEYRRLQDLDFKISILYAGDESLVRDTMKTQQKARAKFCGIMNQTHTTGQCNPANIFMFMESFVGGLLIRQFLQGRDMDDDEIEAAAIFIAAAVQNNIVHIDNHSDNKRINGGTNR
jgi:AcrR family transcriptional regulator